VALRVERFLWLLCVPGCSESDETPPPVVATEAMSETDGDRDVRVPRFVDPASGRLAISLDDHEDTYLEVAEIQTGRTRLLQNGASLGVAPFIGTDIELSTEAATLRVRGAMVAGTHTLTLEQADGSSATSNPIELVLEARGSHRADATMGDRFDRADRLILGGRGARAVLGTIAFEGPAEVHVFAWGEGQWTSSPSIVALPGLNPQSEITLEPWTALEEGEDGRTVAILWTVGAPTNELWGVVHAIGVPPTPRRLLEASSLGPNPGAHAAFGNIILVGNTLLVEHIDPGPSGPVCSVSTAKLEGPALELGPLRRVTLEGGSNVEVLARPVDVAGFGDTPPHHRVLARVGAARPVLFDVFDGLIGVETLPDDAVGLDDDFRSPAAILGTFRSRTIAGSSAGVWSLQFIDGTGRRATQMHSVDRDLVADRAVVTALQGSAVFLWAQGPLVPTIAIVATDRTPVSQPLDALHCDEIAMPATPEGARDGRIGLACRRGSDLYHGTLVLEPV